MDGSNQLQRDELSSISFEKFTVELNPLKTQSVQETLHSIHTHNDSYCYAEEEVHSYRDDNRIGALDTTSDSLFQKYSRQLTMC